MGEGRDKERETHVDVRETQISCLSEARSPGMCTD